MTSNSTRDALKELDALREAADPAPWFVAESGEYIDEYVIRGEQIALDVAGAVNVNDTARLIALAPVLTKEAVALARAVRAHRDGQGFHDAMGTLAICTHGEDCPILIALDSFLASLDEQLGGAK